MAGKGKKNTTPDLIVRNRRARYEYSIEEVFEAGLCLSGTEVKALREGKAQITDSYASPEPGPNGVEMWLLNATIEEYSAGNRENHLPRRPRKLLLKKREISKLTGAVERKGYTLVPLRMYFNGKGRAKIEIGLALGKKLHDKRASEKQRDWGREKQRVLRDYNRG